MNHYFVHDTPIGELILEANLNYLVKIRFNRKHHNRVKVCSLKKNLILEKTVEQLDEYFFHNRTIFTIKYILNTSLFFTRTLEEVSLIQYGKFKSYKEIASSLKNKRAYRAVANANAHNPLPILIPCHRVIKSSGELGGYKGGISIKKYLLNLEGKTGKFY